MNGDASPIARAPVAPHQVTCNDVQRHLIARGNPAPGEYEGAWARWEKALGK